MRDIWSTSRDSRALGFLAYGAVWMSAAGICMLVLLGFALAFSSPVTADIAFKKNATVVGAQVSLKDVATVACADSNARLALNSLAVAKNLVPNFSRVLTTTHISAGCRRLLPLAVFTFSNEGKIEVTRGGIAVSSKEIEDAVTAFILSNMPWHKDDAGIRFTRSCEKVVLPNMPYTITVKPDDQYDFRGSGRFKVTFFQNNEAVHSIRPSVEITAFQEVCVAARNIARNSILSPDNFVLTRMNVTRMHYTPVCDPCKIAGKRTRRTIAKDRIIDISMIDEPALVSAGKAVTLIARHGSVSITLPGISRAEGQAGDVIPVYCVTTKKLLRGSVQKDGTVFVSTQGRI